MKNSERFSLVKGVQVLNRQTMKAVTGGIIRDRVCARTCRDEYRKCLQLGALGCEENLTNCIERCG